MAKSIKLSIKLNAEQIEQVAYWVAALADSNDKDERERLAERLYTELGFSAQTMLTAQESRREVVAYRYRKQMREWRQWASERRRQEVGEVQA